MWSPQLDDYFCKETTCKRFDNSCQIRINNEEKPVKSASHPNPLKLAIGHISDDPGKEISMFLRNSLQANDDCGKLDPNKSIHQTTKLNNVIDTSSKRPIVLDTKFLASQQSKILNPDNLKI
jgi:hypothetical protein